MSIFLKDNGQNVDYKYDFSYNLGVKEVQLVNQKSKKYSRLDKVIIVLAGLLFLILAAFCLYPVIF
jgi:cell division protein FtsL